MVLQEPFPDGRSQNRNLNLYKNLFTNEETEVNSGFFLFHKKHNHMGKTPHQFTFNFSYMYLTDYEKLMWYLKILLEFLRADMFCCTFEKKKFLFEGWTYWNFIQTQDLLKFYYSKLLVLKRATFERIAGESSPVGDKSWHSGIDRTYLDPQQIATSES